MRFSAPLWYTRSLETFQENAYEFLLIVKMKKPSKRSQKPPPAKLGKLIKLVNLLPKEYLAESLNHSESRLAVLNGLAQPLREYLALGDVDSDRTFDEMLVQGGIVGRYKSLWSAGARLRNIARMAESLTIPGSAETSAVFKIDIDNPVRDWIDDQGLVRSSKDWFAEATDGVRADKIRECKVCGKIFWAGRKDARQCGDPACKSTWATKLSRDPELRQRYYITRQVKEALKERKARRAKPAPKR